MGTRTKFVIVVNGPTASGKTGCAIEIAKYLDGEIISADSRQFYREMSIGTAKPSSEEMAMAPHHFIDSLSIQDPYTAGDFERDALNLIDEIHSRGKLPIVCGGSGLYIKAILEGLDSTAVPDVIRLEVRALYREEGLPGLQKELEMLDPDYYSDVDQSNHVRLMRAIEVLRSTGKKMKDVLTGVPKTRMFESIKIGLEVNRELLYERINARVDEMMAAGLEAEARSLHGNKDLQALQTVGYKELFEYFDGAISLERAIELVKQNTRRYAKRQVTWLRKEEDMNWFNPESQEAITAFVANRISTV